jgi:hypothetical protein
MLPYAATVLAARQAAARAGALATFGKVIAEPGGTNGVSAAVRAWLDARAPDEETGWRDGHHGPFGRRRIFRRTRRHAHRAPGVGHPARAFRPGPAGPDRRRPRRGRDQHAGAAHRSRARRRRPGRPGADRHAVRPQPDRHLALPAEHADLADCEAGVRALAAVLETSRARRDPGHPVRSSPLAGRPGLAPRPGRPPRRPDRSRRRPLHRRRPRRASPARHDTPSWPHASRLRQRALARLPPRAALTTQADRGTFWTWRERMYEVAAGSTRTAIPAGPGHLTPRWRWPG